MTGWLDHDDTLLAVGDPVTIVSARPTYNNGSHGVIEKFGTKNVHVCLTRAVFERHDGKVITVLPQGVRKGWHGTPRYFERLANAAENYLVDVLDDAVSAGIITADQRQEIIATQHR